jgi:FtsP/CotA-like multicopper oxidase with cupredoxin domain
VLNIDLNKQPNEFGVGSQDYAPRPYDPGRIDRVLPLGHAKEWSLNSQVFSHPFHIHVNPFQIVAIFDPNGKDVSAPDAIDDYTGAPDANYPGLKGVWKDTIWVKSVRRSDGNFTPYMVVFRTRYRRYIGEYVLHCHILDPEDQGMMQNVITVALPNAAHKSAAYEPPLIDNRAPRPHPTPIHNRTLRPFIWPGNDTANK